MLAILSPMKIFRSSIFMLCVGLLNACAPRTPTLPPTTPTLTATAIATIAAPPVSVVVNFWTVLPDKGINEKNLNELAQAFQKEYPHIVIRVSSAPNYTELFRKVVASIAAGTLPDMVTGLDYDLAEYARLKSLVPLDDYIYDPTNGLSLTDVSDIPSAFQETMRLPGQGTKIYSLPFARGAVALYYHWTAMKNIGITNAPKDWNEFRLHAATINKLTRNAVRGYAYQPDATWFAALLQSRGGALFNTDWSRATFNSQAGIDTLLFLGDGLKEGWIYRVDGVKDMEDFVAGKTLFNIGSTAEIPVYQNVMAEALKKGGKEFEWGIAPLPQHTAKPTAIVVGSNIAMLKSVPAKQQAAWLFMRWLLNAKASAEWTQATGVLPTRNAARERLTSFYAKSPQQKQAIEDVLPSARPEPNVRNMPDVRELIETAIASFESDRNNPNKAKAVLDDAAAKATILVSEKK